ALLDAAACGFGRRGRARGTATAAARARGLILIGLERRPRGRRSRRGILAEALLRFLLGLDLGLEVVLAALVLVGLARLRGLALPALCGPPRLADERFLLRDLALFRLAQPGIVERMDARLLLLLGQAAQHQAAGRLGRRGGRNRARSGGRRGRGGGLAGRGSL